jgi:UTP-glucose-1-phosphate uridylyltransferase
VIAILPSTSEHVVIASASGHVDAKDYVEVLIPAIEEVLATGNKVRLLYHVGSDFEGFTASAIWEDSKLGLGHATAWEKIALVTDVVWLATAAKLFRFTMSCPVRVFSNNELSIAQSWIAA